jgi:hypothetical protein
MQAGLDAMTVAESFALGSYRLLWVYSNFIAKFIVNASVKFTEKSAE